MKVWCVNPDNLPQVTIYTDGGCLPNPGLGAWAALLVFQSNDGQWIEEELTGYEPYTTNNRMELTAAIQALEALRESFEVQFYTDSEYLKNGITVWIKNWLEDNWGGGIKNQDLWMRLYQATQPHIIHWHWTRGHAGDPHNRRVHQLLTKTLNQVRRSIHQLS